MPKEIHVKCQPRYFAHTISHAKPFEIRRDDRPYEVGDILIQDEWDPVSGYTGRHATCHIMYLLRPDGTVATEGLKAGFVGIGLWCEKTTTDRKKENEHD